MTLRVGISTCPNDTFAFHHLLAGGARTRDWDIVLLDIQELNERLREGSLDVAKASFHVALHVARDYGILPVGAALGFGVGPLLLSQQSERQPDEHSVVLCPGRDTTAALLVRCLFPRIQQVKHCHFAEIMPALQAGHADFGVVIHEGRFTYAEHGLQRVADLGELWEQRTGSPLPLGGLLARRDLPATVLAEVIDAVRESLRFANAHRAATLPTMRRHAQELTDDVIWRHVDLYVSAQTLQLDELGQAALERLFSLAREAGIVAADAPQPALLANGPSTGP